jgi:hypothetical protein
MLGLVSKTSVAEHSSKLDTRHWKDVSRHPRTTAVEKVMTTMRAMSTARSPLNKFQPVYSEEMADDRASNFVPFISKSSEAMTCNSDAAGIFDLLSTLCVVYCVSSGQLLLRYNHFKWLGGTGLRYVSAMLLSLSWSS